uniref:Uncharacterized protein n=1 Tax=Anguilla anguilla TaxID=7936 RepID=A0A0E9U7Q0_ANGAN
MYDNTATKGDVCLRTCFSHYDGFILFYESYKIYV